MTLEKILKENKNYIHGSNIYTKLKGKNSKQAKELKTIYEKHIQNIKQINYKQSDEKIIKEKVKLLNDYYNSYKNSNFDDFFKPQSRMRLTILEEFLYILFENFTDNIKKDQDYAIYRPLSLIVNGNPEKQINLPIITIEAKTYIDKTMLEGSIATAEKIKSGNPYAKFFMVSETYEVDQSVDPTYSRIDQIYVLRKSDTRGSANPINYDVVYSLYCDVKSHLERDWGNIGKKLSESGKII